MRKTNLCPSKESIFFARNIGLSKNRAVHPPTLNFQVEALRIHMLCDS
jgi:hypothetical protein